jgi:hypothetical protein
MINLNEMWTDETPSIRTQLIRNFKLFSIREQRAALLVESDLMGKDIAIGIRADKDAVKTYVLALRNFTEALKTETDKNVGTEALDAIGINNIVWPVKP